jgi:hypothetical protein
MWPLLHQLIMYFGDSFYDLMANRFIIHDTDYNFIIFRNFLNFYHQQTSTAILETCEYVPFILEFWCFAFSSKCIQNLLNFLSWRGEWDAYNSITLLVPDTRGAWKKSKLAQHAYEEGHKICWKEVKVLQIEPKTTYRKYKECAHMSPIDHPISQPNVDISPIWTSITTEAEKNYSSIQDRLSGKIVFFMLILFRKGARGSVVGWGPMLQAGRPRVRFSMRSLSFFNLPNPSSHNMALGLTQPLTEISTRKIPGGKGWWVCKADNLTAICKLIV